MTKTQYINYHCAAATELTGSPIFIAMLDTAREECPFLGKEIADPTGIVRNEGRMQGWFAALAFLKTAHVVPKPKQEHIPTGAYKDPNDFNEPKK